MAHARRDDSAGIATVTFTRDEKLNAVSPEMIDLLRAAVDDLGDRDHLRALVIAAEGRHFTAGMDIGAIDLSAAQGSDGAPDGIGIRRYYRRLHLLFDEIEAIEKPVVLAAQGPCRG
ncbi:MAG: putative acyl-CoA hydratase, partial [Acidimicrobiia bacterium]|nr:putative acyl-CoA hydratase [Acidimicrobiia bacterium]